VLELVAEGHSNAAIARTLGLGEETVKRHLRRLLFKLEARNRVQLVTNGVKRGFIR
jgi:DNA-binding CsgD family transcriptional regulator